VYKNKLRNPDKDIQTCETHSVECRESMLRFTRVIIARALEHLERSSDLETSQRWLRHYGVARLDLSTCRRNTRCVWHYVTHYDRTNRDLSEYRGNASFISTHRMDVDEEFRSWFFVEPTNHLNVLRRELYKRDVRTSIGAPLYV